MTAASGSGPMTDGLVASPEASVPVAPSIAARLAEAENKVNNLYDMMQRAERVFGNLIVQNTEMREQLGMATLPPDYFS